MPNDRFPPPRRAGLVPLGLCALAVLAAATACGRESPQSVPELPGPAPIPAVTLMIEDNTFGPLPPITPGARVTVVNNDQVRHSVTSGRPGLFDRTVEPGAAITFTAPEEIGSHPFHCRYHQFMDGWFSIRT